MTGNKANAAHRLRPKTFYPSFGTSCGIPPLYADALASTGAPPRLDTYSAHRKSLPRGDNATRLLLLSRFAPEHFASYFLVHPGFVARGRLDEIPHTFVIGREWLLADLECVVTYLRWFSVRGFSSWACSVTIFLNHKTDIFFQYVNFIDWASNKSYKYSDRDTFETIYQNRLIFFESIR